MPETALEVIDHGNTVQTIVRAAPGDVVEAFREYQRIQMMLDQALPDCIQNISGKKFRKKNYWRAIATAFNLTVSLSQEERTEQQNDWGWLVSYRATAPNGRSADGDGTCMSSEKQGKQATLHNVRAHAHTRAFNRAVSNLVGFGEVSAEEFREDDEPAPRKFGRRQEPVEDVDTRPVTQTGAPPWFGEVTGFGKKDKSKTLSINGEKVPMAEVTWEQLAGGKVGGGRYAWLADTLTWAKDQEQPGQLVKLFIERATIVLAMMEGAP